MSLFLGDAGASVSLNSRDAVIDMTYYGWRPDWRADLRHNTRGMIGINAEHSTIAVYLSTLLGCSICRRMRGLIQSLQQPSYRYWGCAPPWIFGVHAGDGTQLKLKTRIKPVRKLPAINLVQGTCTLPTEIFRWMPDSLLQSKFVIRVIALLRWTYSFCVKYMHIHRKRTSQNRRTKQAGCVAATLQHG